MLNNKLFTNLKKIWLEPKIYSLVMRNENNREDMVVWQVCAFTLEEAMSKAKHEINDSLSSQERKDKNYKMIMYASDSPEKLLKNYVENFDSPVKGTGDLGSKLRSKIEKTLGLPTGTFQTRLAKPKPAFEDSPDGESANGLIMKKIIQEKNLDLFEKSKSILSESEQLYVKSKLKIK